MNVLADARRGRAATNDPGRGVPVHPAAGPGPQQWAGRSVSGELVDRA
ncbi:MAG: hypothetical protein QOC80_2115, partial [Frankiaceae bacterium]|nr:hypothetical protein [Frankiaceae bacterium]